MGERPAGTPLDKKLIVTTALRLLDEVGLDGLTLRRLATELGVRAPALYWHVRNKRELLDAMSEAMIAATLPESMRRPAPGQPWWEWLAERSRAIRRASLARRDGALVMLGNRPTLDSLPGIEHLLSVLSETGLPPHEALEAVLALGTYTMGWVVEEQATRRRSRDGSPEDLADSDRAVARSMTDASRFPLLAEAANHLGPGFEEAAFEFGLATMIDGIRARAEQAATLARSAGGGGRGDEEVEQPVELGDRVVSEPAVDR